MSEKLVIKIDLDLLAKDGRDKWRGVGLILSQLTSDALEGAIVSEEIEDARGKHVGVVEIDDNDEDF
jgi:hypothetical protein